MITIKARNVNYAWEQAKMILEGHGVWRKSRVGDCKEVPEPVTTCYERPVERVLFDPVRDANPFFHLMEGLWMLAGRQDVAWISHFAKRMMSYSDDGTTFHAAYGFRWRQHFDLDGGGEDDFADQIKKVIAILKADPDSRRAVIGMWDPRCDLWSPAEIARNQGKVPKDLPCNTTIFFKIRDGNLLMTVANRSNDIVWGCYGANVVHMSMLQEYVAGMIGVGVGTYHQVSDSWHAYREVWSQQRFIEKFVDPYDRVSAICRTEEPIWSYTMITHPEYWDADLHQFMQKHWEESEYINPFFHEIARPMRLAHQAYKNGNLENARVYLRRMPDNVDWQVAGLEWIGRRTK